LDIEVIEGDACYHSLCRDQCNHDWINIDCTLDLKEKDAFSDLLWPIDSAGHKMSSRLEEHPETLSMFHAMLFDDRCDEW
jgi:hypothetical protein